MKGTRWMKCLSLSLSLKRLRGGAWGSSFTGDPGRYVQKVSGCGHLSMGAPFSPGGSRYVGRGRIPRTLIDEWRRVLVLGHLSVRDSVKGALGRGPFTGEPERWGFWEICKMTCRRASLFTGALLRNLEEFVCRDFWEKIKVYLGSFLGPGGH
jgi:hypothetical protein